MPELRLPLALPDQLRADALAIPGCPVRLGRTPVTNGQLCDLLNGIGFDNLVDGGYRALNVCNPDQPVTYELSRESYVVRAGLADHPVVGVPWHGAVILASLLGARLPTVREWTLAAGGADGRYPWGDQVPSPERANYEEHVGSTSVVGAYPANGHGFVDLAGNVGEWCLEGADDGNGVDWPDLAHPDPRLTRTYPIKGGGWNKSAHWLRNDATRRKWGRTGTIAVGLRLAFDD